MANPPTQYTCREYREEMLLLGLKRQAENPELPEAQRLELADKIRKLELEMGLD
jgi:hypothetical protein